MFRSDLFVSAFVRRHNDLGQFTVVERHGDALAGAIHIRHDHLDGTETLYGPAPMTARLDNPEARVFVRVLAHAKPAEVTARLAREADFDPDIWVIAIEARGEDVGLDLARP